MAPKTLRRGLGLWILLASLPLAAQTPPYDRTVVVGGSAAPAVNGANLVAALAAIPSPGPANRWLVKVEPGEFDLGTQALVLRDYVDVEGSGRGVTTLTSAIRQIDPVVDPVTGSTLAPGGGTIYGHPGVHVEVRELLARNTSSQWGTGVLLRSGSVRLTRIDVEIDSVNGGTGVTLDDCAAELTDLAIRLEASSVYGSLSGVFAPGAAPRLSRVQVTAVVPDSGLVRAVHLQDSAATVDDLTVTAPVAGIVNQRSIGLLIDGGRPRITNAWLTVEGAQCYGIRVEGGGEPEIRDAEAEASTGFTAVGMIVVDASAPRVYGSRLRGDAINGAGVLTTSGTATVLQHSVAEGTAFSYSGPAGTLTFASTQLIGPRPGGAACVCSYDGAFAPLNGPC